METDLQEPGILNATECECPSSNLAKSMLTMEKECMETIESNGNTSNLCNKSDCTTASSETNEAFEQAAPPLLDVNTTLIEDNAISSPDDTSVHANDGVGTSSDELPEQSLAAMSSSNQVSSTNQSPSVKDDSIVQESNDVGVSEELGTPGSGNEIVQMKGNNSGKTSPVMSGENGTKSSFADADDTNTADVTVEDEPELDPEEIFQALGERLEGLLVLNQAKIADLEKSKRLLQENESACRQGVEHTFKDVFNQLKERKKTVSVEISAIVDKKSESFIEEGAKLTDVSFRLQELSEMLNYMKSNVSLNVQEASVKISKEIEACLPAVQCPMMLENSFMHYSNTSLVETTKFVKKLGKLTTSPIFASNCRASGDGIRKCIVGKSTLIKLTMKSHDGEIVPDNAISHIHALIKKAGVEILPKISETSRGVYDLVYIVPSSGDYTLDVYVFNQPIKDSPFSVRAAPGPRVDTRAGTSTGSFGGVYILGKATSPAPPSPRSPRLSTPSSASLVSVATTASVPIENPYHLETIGRRGRGSGEFCNPQGVAMMPSGGVVVADSSNQNIQVLDKDRSLIAIISARGREAGQILRPTGIAVTAKGNLLVADYETKWISVFSKDGVFKKRFGGGKLSGPKGVAVTKQGDILVADNKGNKVVKFSATGKLLKVFEKEGGMKFKGPHYIAISSTGDVIVTDFHSHSCKVLSPEGTLRFSFGSNGKETGQFNSPTGVAVDEYDNILVADWGNSRVQVFDKSGSFLSQIDTRGADLFGPQAIATGGNSTVIISDSGHHCLKIFSYEAQIIE